jgi:hypothetical protein
LEPCGDETVDVITNGYKDFSCEMSALLSPVELILEMDTGSTVLGKELRELDDC